MSSPGSVVAGISALDVRDMLRELAERYEQVVALDLPDIVGQITAVGTGSRVPPGAWVMLLADEVTRVLADVDEHAVAWCHMLLDDDVIDAVPDLTPARLRLAAKHAAWFVQDAGEQLAIEVDDDAARLQRKLRHLATRGDRRIPTGRRCVTTTCTGWLVSTLGEAQDGSLECDLCGARVPFETWRHWPLARVQFITVEHAAKILGCTTNAVYLRASRGQWGRVGSGRDVRYNVEDVRAAASGD